MLIDIQVGPLENNRAVSLTEQLPLWEADIKSFEYPQERLTRITVSVADFLMDLHTDILPGSAQVNFPAQVLQGLDIVLSSQNLSFTCLVLAILTEVHFLCD